MAARVRALAALGGLLWLPMASAEEEAAASPSDHASILQGPLPQREDRQRDTRFTIGPLALLFGAVSIEVEDMATDHLSTQLGFTAAELPRIVPVNARPPLQLNSGVRLFPFAEIPEPSGPWVGFGAVFWWAPGAVVLGGAQASLGYTFIGAEGFTGSFGAGLMALAPLGEFAVFVIAPDVHLNLGYAF